MASNTKNALNGKERLMICLICIMGFVFRSEAQNRSISLIRKESESIRPDCKCTISRFSIDSNIYIKQLEGKYEITLNKRTATCFETDLLIYNRKISLDSIYYANIKNKDLVYNGLFNGGIYIKDKQIIKLSLDFLNVFLNSSTPSYHTFFIAYDLKKKKIIEAKIQFKNK